METVPWKTIPMTRQSRHCSGRTLPNNPTAPRLRTHVRRGKSGQVYVYYAYDMRPEGKPDIPLGKDHAQAIAQWDSKSPRRKACRFESGPGTMALQLWF